MSGWLGYTKRILGSAISTIAQELEQTVVDFNDAVQEMGTSDDMIAEQTYSDLHSCNKKQELSERESFELLNKSLANRCHSEDNQIPALSPRCCPVDKTTPALTPRCHPEEQQIPALTRQAVVRSYIPCMSTWPTTCLPPTFITTQPRPTNSSQLSTKQMSHSQVCNGKVLELMAEEECGKYDSIHHENTRYASYTSCDIGCSLHGKGVVRMRLGEKRPGKVVRTSSSSEPDEPDAMFDAIDEEVSMISLQQTHFSVGGTRILTPEVGHEVIRGSQALVPYSATAENQFSPKWLGFFTFALAQVTSAVWMILDNPQRRTSNSHSPQPRNIQTVPNLGDQNQQTKDNPNQHYSAIRLEVHRPLNSPYQIKCQEDPRLISPVSVCSTYSSESFEIIETPAAKDSPPELFKLWSECYESQRGSPSCDKTVSDSGLVSEPMVISSEGDPMTCSSAEWIDFDFSNLVSNQQTANMSFKDGSNSLDAAFDSSAWIENHFSSDCKSPRCRWEAGVAQQHPSAVHLYVVESDDGSSSFDVLSDPGEEDFVMY